MNNIFLSNEKLYRAVSPREMFWKGDRPSSACFKDSKGLSVNRSGSQRDDEAVKQLETQFSKNPPKSVVSVVVQQCIDLSLHLKYAPEPHNEFHSEIHRDEQTPPLTSGQARALASSCSIEKLY